MIRLILVLVCALPFLQAQHSLSGSVAARLALEKLANTGSVLMIAAHPDDENTAVLAYFARGRKLRTGYLSLNRGEGGQNLLGSEQGAWIGLIRTQELLAARRIDGAEQLFARAIDFGFSKTAEETLAKWGKEQVLADVVYLIRKFQPDVVINRFSGTKRDGHGNHQVAGILSKEAFRAAGDPNRFPEQLTLVKPWQAKRLFWNVFAFTPEQEKEADKLQQRLLIDTGQYDPLLGYSYTEIAGMSRSQHRSQAMGSAERKGSQRNHLVLVDGERATTDALDGIDTTWRRLPGGAPLAELLEKTLAEFDMLRPDKSVPALLQARTLLAKLEGPIAERKRGELDELIGQCLGLWLDASADRAQAVAGSTVKVLLSAISRAPIPVKLLSATLAGQPAAELQNLALTPNKLSTESVSYPIPASQPFSQPYWLQEPVKGALYSIPSQQQLGAPESQPVLEARFRIEIEGTPIEYTRPVARRYVDPANGETVDPFIIVPAVTLTVAENTMLFPSTESRSVEVVLTAARKGVTGEARLQLPAGWRYSPESVPFQLTEEGQRQVVQFALTPPPQKSEGELHAVAIVDGKPLSASVQTIRYPHIPPQTVFPPATAKLIREDIKLTVKRVGYIMGAGDEMPEAIRQLGAEVTLLSALDLATSDLSRFDAIVAGVRAYNVRPDVRANQQRLMDYVKQGGTYLVQYNMAEGGFSGDRSQNTARMGPYPFKISRERISVEEAEVTYPDPSSPIYSTPNKLTKADYDNWVQERGLYFPVEWDPQYKPLFTMQDPGEKPLLGGTLYTHYGKGAYIYTGLAWFRQLPAGVPGAYRVFANLLSAGSLPQ